ncbi:hypothetical protein OEZ85_001762 [Tetradesmus obliquus]|uniref:Right handed beta helix domain-containing protein n=1 Tax=Tetradesmus obliquus TaxID=3088 RepID=A0ABY8U1T1_TETOB|nr:hypothetical protein OEZ85_001762 [Tetradesmus obliquus]
MIDFAPSNFDTDRAAVMAAAGPGNTFRMKDLQLVFNGKSGAGACKDDKPYAVIRVEGFKSVSFENVGINTYYTVISSGMPASGIHIKGADTIKLDTVKVSSVAEHGILVEDGGEVEATDVSAGGCGKDGVHYTGCYQGTRAGISFRKGSFLINGNSGLWMDCDFAHAPLASSAVPVAITNVSFYRNAAHGMWLRGSFEVTLKGGIVMDNGVKSPALCGGGVRVILRNTADVKTSLVVDGTKVTRNRAKYGGGICFQSRLADGVSGPSYQQSLLKLTGNPWLKDNKAEVCGGGMATIGNMVTERMAITIDKGVEISGNRADKGKTWCDTLPAQDDDGATTLDNFKSIWFTESQDKRRALRQILAAHPAA